MIPGSAAGKVSPRLIRPRFVLFDWGDTLMSEDGPTDVTMADWRTVQAIHGAAEVLRRLHLNHTLAVCTNATVSRRPDIERALKRVGLGRYITAIFCHTELGHRKEEPAFWHAVLTRLGAQPAEAVMVGDTLEPDVLAPLRNGIPSVWFNWKRAPEPAVIGFPVIYRLENLPPLLDRIP